MTLKVQHKRSAVRGKAPLPTDLEFGEIAINYEASNPSFYIKDSAGAIRRIGSQLGALVFKGSLAPTAAAPTAPNIGDVYVMSADGTMAASWVGVAGRLVVRSENIAWSGTEWESLGNDRVHGIHIGETPPATPSPGQQWFHSSKGKLFVYYDDGTGAAQWVVANPQEAVDYTRAVMKAGDTMTGNLVLPTVNGGVPDRLNRAGNILQVVNATYSTVTTNSTTTYTDTGLTATITPTSSSSKILALVNQAGCHKSSANPNNGVHLKLFRGSTELSLFSYATGYSNSALELFAGEVSINYLDSPATTSLLTYKTQFANNISSASVSVQYYNVTSTITLLEVAA